MEVTEYNAGTRQGPPLATPELLDLESATHDAQTTNLICSLVRMADTSELSVSLWNSFSMMTRDSVIVKKDTVRYLPAINTPVMQMSAVCEILNQVLRIKNALDHEEIVSVFDQALYGKAAEITWKHHDMYRQIVL